MSKIEVSPGTTQCFWPDAITPLIGRHQRATP
jgi:hypothetical protein